MKVFDDKEQVCAMIYMKKEIKIDQQLMHVDSISLFLSLVMIMERWDIYLIAFSMNIYYSLTYYGKIQQYEVLQYNVGETTDYKLSGSKLLKLIIYVLNLANHFVWLQ